MCVHFPKGSCLHGDKCSFAHSKAELRAKPCRFGSRCKNDSCNYSHDFEEGYYYDEDEEEEVVAAPVKTKTVVNSSVAHPPAAATAATTKAQSAKGTPYVTPGPSPAGTPWKLHNPEPEKPKPAAIRSTQISDLPDLVSRISQLGHNWTDEVIAWAVFRVATMKNLGPGGSIMDSEVIDLLHANPGKGRRKNLVREVETVGSPSNKECIICLEEEREVVLVPCGHATFCFDCGEGIQRTRECPTCRCEVTSVMRFFA